MKENQFPELLYIQKGPFNVDGHNYEAYTEYETAEDGDIIAIYELAKIVKVSVVQHRELVPLKPKSKSSDETESNIFPEGYRFIARRVPKPGDLFVNKLNQVQCCTQENSSRRAQTRVIVAKTHTPL